MVSVCFFTPSVITFVVYWRLYFVPRAWHRYNPKWRRHSTSWQPGFCQVKTADVTSIPRIADFVSLLYFSSTSQIYAQIVRHGILGGLPTTLGYSSGM